MSTAMPIRCMPPPAATWLSSQRTRSQIQWPSVCCMRKLWSMWSILPEINWSAMSNRLMSSDFTSALTSPKVRRSLRESEPEQSEHRLRPEDTAARQIPVPKAAAAAVERGVDPAPYRVIDEVALAGAGRLPVKGKAEDQHHKACRRRQRHRQRRVRSPQRLVPFLDDHDLAGQGLHQQRDRKRLVAVRKDHVRDDALMAGRGQQLRRADDVEHAVVLAEAVDRDASQNAMVGAGDDDVTAGGDAPGWNEVRQQALQPLDIGHAILPDRGETVETLGQDIGERQEVALDGGALLAVLVDHLHEGAEADGDQEGDDEGRHGAAQRRLGGQQPVIGRLRNRLRQSLDRIGLDARVRRMRARHALDPHRKCVCTPSGSAPRCFRNQCDLNPVFPRCRESTIR